MRACDTDDSSDAPRATIGRLVAATLADDGRRRRTDRDVSQALDLLPDVERGGVHRAGPRRRPAGRARSSSRRATSRDYELIVVDDASTDRTGEIADRMAAADPHVRVVHHQRNRKLGGSMKTGFAAATGDLVLYTDADLPFDMAELPRAVRLLREYDVDIVSAYRFDRTGEGYAAWPSTRSSTTCSSEALFGVKVRDINFAFKLCRRRIFDHVELQSEGSFIDAELIIRATRPRLRDHPVRRRLLPAHPRRVDAELAGDHPQDPPGDVDAAHRPRRHREGALNRFRWPDTGRDGRISGRTADHSEFHTGSVGACSVTPGATSPPSIPVIHRERPPPPPERRCPLAARRGRRRAARRGRRRRCHQQQWWQPERHGDDGVHPGHPELVDEPLDAAAGARRAAAVRGPDLHRELPGSDHPRW